MKSEYPNLLSPIKLGSMMLKNRLVSANAMPHFLQGPESFPTEPLINHVVSCARNGATIVTVADWTGKDQRNSFNEDGKHFPMFDIDDPSVENYICQMADQIHYYGSRASIALISTAFEFPMFSVSFEPAVDLAALNNGEFSPKDMIGLGMGAFIRKGKAAQPLSHKQIHDIIERHANRVKWYKSLGFDMCTLHLAYRASLFGRFISPITNRRTDEYGGSLENRARAMLELCSRIKELCGKDFPIEVQLTPVEEGGNTIEDTIALAKISEGLVDIFQFRSDNANISHPTSYNSSLNHYDVLENCAAVKRSGTKILCEPIGGFQNPSDMEEIIASGKADLIGAARAFIADFDFYQKIIENRADDIVPCIRCNKCHVPSLHGNWLSICSVNPEMGIAHKLDKMVRPVRRKKKVAVVGGGPAGMRSALFCEQRGHEVTLFEASDKLGGQLSLMDDLSFKWTLVNYRGYLVNQLAKSNVEIKLNSPADKKMLEKGDYDAVILALGAKPKTPPIPGAEKCYNIFSVLGHEKELGHRCVVVGGSESGTEAGLYLAEHGHDVTILTRGNMLASDATPIHYKETIDEYAESLTNFKAVLNAATTKIGSNYVKYTDKEGLEHTLDCDSVVALGGMKPRHDETMALYGTASETYIIGDCSEPGNLHKCNRSAYAAANQI